MHAIDVAFGGDSETTQVFRVGEASCAVPGTAAGLEALHAGYGRLPWRELLQPAIELARAGVELTRPQAHLHAILDLILRHSDEGRRLYSRADGSRLLPGDLLQLPDLGATLERIAEEGARPLYTGELAHSIVDTVEAGGGLLTLDDLSSYRVVWRRPVRVPYRGFEVISNPPPSSGGILIAYGLALLERTGRGAPGSAEAIASLVGVMREQTRARGDGFDAALHRGGLARRLLSPEALAAAVARIEAEAPGATEHRPAGGTTHVSVVDGDGNAASLSSSTGSGSGVIVPGTGIHLNNMLGEYDLVGGGPTTPGQRLTSMMAPTVVRGATGPRLVVGSAGSVRLRGAIMQVIVNVVGHDLGVAAAIDAPRVHVDEPHVHCEGGFDPAVLEQVESWATTSCAGDAATCSSAGRTPSRCFPIRRWRPRATRGAAATASSSPDRRSCLVALRRRDLAVLARALAHHPLEPHRFERGLEQHCESLHAQPRRGHCEHFLLRIDAEVDPRRQLEVELRDVGLRKVDLALRGLGELAKHLERPVDVGLRRRIVVVDHRLHEPGRERPAGGQLEQAKALASFDDDVHPSVVEHLQHLEHRRPRPDLMDRTVAGGEHEAEVGLVLDALLDQLAVARLEDVQRNPLRGNEHDRQREEAKLRHASSLRGRRETSSRHTSGTLSAQTRNADDARLAVGRRPGTP